MTRWLTAAQLIDLQLPALPADKGGLSRRIAKEGWQTSPLARQANGVWEYNMGLLPAEAQAELLARELREAAATAPVSPTSQAWEDFERLPEKSKATARERLAIVDQVATLRGGAMNKAEAVALVAKRASVSSSTLWGWIKLCDGRPRPDWLAALAPQYKGRTSTADCDPRAWDFFIADYLRPEQPSLSACYRRLQDTAAVHKWAPIPAVKTLQRRLERSMPAPARAMARQGRDAVARMFPHQTRDRAGFAAMQAVNADGHLFDVFVRWEDGTVGRPVATVIQDLGTGMIVGHRLGESENWSAVRLAFADMVERYGIPEDCWLDNGRAFASKWLTGGMKTRFRFKVRDDEPAGILTQLGVKVHWTTPYHGQAKPIERAFRDLCEEIAKHPACAGAYTGNAVNAKPENYASRAIPIADFRALVASEIARHNARSGRRGAGLNGGSFADAFTASLNAPGTVVIRATQAQRRLLLMAAEGVTCRKPTGEIQLGGNRYWAEELVPFSGLQVVVRFDPDDLHAPVAIYAKDGRLICEAPAIEATGFADSVAAQAHSRTKRQWIKAQREVLNIEKRLGIDDVAGLLPKLPAAPAAAAAPKVIRMVSDAGAPPTADDRAASSFGRAVRALADDDQDHEVVPFRGAGTG
jgi:transposase InsO family protein